MRLAFVVQRYGREVLGGAETLARQIAERLSRRHEVDVLTTTAMDYVTWKNQYPEGEEKLRGVRILRFPVRAERDLEEFNKYSDWLYNNPHRREDELRWLEMQGPITPELVECLRREQASYDLLIFFTYLYYPTFHGITIAPEKSVLIPTAHDEPPLKLGIYKDVFESPVSLIFNTEEEERLVVERFDVLKKMRETIGIGMEHLDQPDVNEVRRRLKLPGRYLLYAGRIDAGKGCEELIRFFRFFRDEHPDISNLQLLLMGQLAMKLPQARDVRYLGFLDEADKLAAMAAALAVVISSRYESLSIVALEAFSVGTPVLVHSGSKVLVEHCRVANAGLYYGDFDEFEQVLALLLQDKTLAKSLGKQGQKYIKKHFGWEKLLAQYEQAFRAAARPPRPGSSFAERQEKREPVAEAASGPIRDSEKASSVKEAASVEEEPSVTAGEGSETEPGETPPETASSLDDAHDVVSDEKDREASSYSDSRESWREGSARRETESLADGSSPREEASGESTSWGGEARQADASPEGREPSGPPSPPLEEGRDESAQSEASPEETNKDDRS